ncbi:hypothetical protein HA145_03515 [Prochlorococcus marinus XMU1411]|uniref:hypothetical protein n=1 Tax=Prochlorococcus marinus TaxID=1219 RepID=UPI001ADA3674|nr:hypothetical protein [Prochlorococcus marinus]MBO8243542.1 hypothetical protein [Prochlorococcus marinus XMU1411]MBW3054657.1 hypothetical protein [Prochlorococcus marinus str. MU1411]MCR8538236.1 hypothetical protein [Prochlorococcus marinus CUG1430]
MNKKQICIFLLFFFTGCSKNNPILFNNFQAIRCESNIQDEKYNDYIFDLNDGKLYFYDQKKDEFFLKSERYESGYFSEDSIEFYSKLLDNKLIITTIEYGYDTSKKDRKIKHIINTKKLSKKTFEIIGSKNHFLFISKCFWIDPKLGIKY